MIFANNTPNNAGVAIYGDSLDFDKLYESLHKVVKHENMEGGYFPSSTRVLSICYDIRHALLGNRETAFINNGLDDEKKRRLTILAPDKNVYYKIYALWPEIIFVTLALNDLLDIYAKDEAKVKYSRNLYAEPKICWDETIAIIRSFQAAITKCLKDTISPTSFTRLLNLLNDEYVSTENYLIQYIDQLNDRFLKMDNDKRLKSILTMGKRIAEQDEEYQQLSAQFFAEAKRRRCSINDLRIAIDEPEFIDW